MYRDLKFTHKRGYRRQPLKGGFHLGYRASSRRRTYRPRHRFVRGRDRTAGYYGRFTGKGAIELKFHDVNLDDTAIATGGTIASDSINKIPQGVTEVTRIGRKCTIRQINWRFNIAQTSQSDQTDPPKGDVIRILLVLDKQCNGAAAAITDLLESDDYQSFNNLANKSRFRVLMDRKYNIGMSMGQTDGTNTGAYPEINITDSLYKRVNIPIEFDDTASTGALTTIRANNIFAITMSKNGTCQFLSKMRLRFSDV